MNRAALEHVLRAAAEVSGEQEFVVIGSQAVLGQFPAAPAALLASIEVDLFPRLAPGKSIVVDGAIGELSDFHQSFGYYAHGVDERTATLPDGWIGRLVPVRSENTRGATGWCLEVHDLATSKLVAGRDKDLEYLRVLLVESLVEPAVIHDRLRTLAVPVDVMKALHERLDRVERASDPDRRS